MGLFKKTGEYLTGKKKIKNPKDAIKAYGGYLDDITDPLGITDAFGPGPSRPNVSGLEQANEQILSDLSRQIPSQYVETRYAGDFKPETIRDIQRQGDSELNNISVDPQFKDAQLAALSAMQERVDGGYSVEDRAAINKALNEASMQERASRDALMANAQARGVGGSGVALARQLASQQNAANTANQNALDIAAEGRRRALEAAMATGQLSTGMRGQEFDQQARIASAQDAINQFNTKNTNDLAYYNTGVKNTAGLRNADTRQGINNTNAAGRNQFNQNQFDNRMGVAQVKYNNNTNKINNAFAQYQGEVDKREKQKDRVVNGVLTAGSAYMGGK